MATALPRGYSPRVTCRTCRERAKGLDQQTIRAIYEVGRRVGPNIVGHDLFDDDLGPTSSLTDTIIRVPLCKAALRLDPKTDRPSGIAL